MVFNWFKRKFADSDDAKSPDQDVTPDALMEEDEADTDDENEEGSDSEADEESSDAETDQDSAEDYLAWAQAAFENLEPSNDSETAVETDPTASEDSTSEVAEPEVAEPEVIKAEDSPEPDIEEPDIEEEIAPEAEASQELEAIAEPEPDAEPAPHVDNPPPSPVAQKPLKSSKRSTEPEMDEGFRWSAEVLAAQGRKVEEVSVEEITWLKKLRTGLGKTRRGLVNQLKSVVGKGPLSQDAVEEIETLLLQADVGIEATDIIVESLQEKLKEETIPADEAIAYLKKLLVNMLDRPYQEGGYIDNFAPSKQQLNIWLMAGVNGVGKTTTIGKLTSIATSSGYSCLIAAADTFRAAAVQQVKVWGERSQVDVICNPGQNTDPASVVFDAISAAQSRQVELLLVDTAGRLQNKKNLMDELAKVRRIIEKKAPEAQVESLLVLDATLGQNGLRQAQVFAEAAQLTGVVLTKLDGTAKGGVAIGVVQQLGLPIRFIGAGEGINDLRPFSSYEFVEALLSS